MVGNFFKNITNYLKLYKYEIFSLIRKVIYIILKIIIFFQLYWCQLFKKKINIHDQKNYVFFLYGGIGDYLMTRELILSLNYNNKIILFIDKKNSFLSNIFKDTKIILYDKKSFLKLIYNLKNKVSKDSYFISWSSSIESMLIFILSNCSNFIGVMGNFKFIYNNLTKYQNNEKNRYLVNKSIYEKIHPNKNAKNSSFLSNNAKILNNSQNYIVIHPHKTSEWGDVSLPANEWVKLINDIYLKTKLKVILVGTKKEEIKSIKIYNKVVNKNNISNLTGKTSFDELCKIIKESKCIISGDTGVMHLAYQFKKHVIALFTFSNPNVYKPKSNTSVIYNKKIECQPCISTPRIGSDNYPPICFNNYKCSKSIKSDEIITSLLKYLN